jgi:hypothetical protein
MDTPNKEELEDKLIEGLSDNNDGSGKTKKLVIVGGIIIGLLIIVAIALSFFGGKKKTGEPGTGEGAAVGTSGEASLGEPEIVYDQTYSRDPDSATAKKAGEPNNPYPPRTSGARVPVTESGASIERTLIQKSVMLDERVNPFYALQMVTPEIFDLTEINIYDINNQKLPLKDFVKRAQVEIPETLAGKLADSYRILMYRAPGEKGPGTAWILASNAPKEESQKNMLEWEKTMINGLRPFVNIGLNKDFVAASGNNTFGNSGKHEGGRLVDFSENGVVSLNYLILDKSIVIGNSRSAFEKAVAVVQNKQ